MTTEKTYPVRVFGPNIGHGGEFHVHAPGCADITRGKFRHDYAGEYSMDFNALSEQHVVEEVYSDQIREAEEGESSHTRWQEYAADFRFFPCCKLPAETPKEAS